MHASGSRDSVRTRRPVQQLFKFGIGRAISVAEHVRDAAAVESNIVDTEYIYCSFHDLIFFKQAFCPIFVCPKPIREAFVLVDDGAPNSFFSRRCVAMLAS